MWATPLAAHQSACNLKKWVANKLDHACKVMVVCPKCGKPTRVAHKITDGKKARICKKCGAEL